MVAGDDEPKRRVGADVDDVAVADPEDRAATAGCDLQVMDLLARLVGRQQVFAPILDPAHRPADPAGEKRDDELLAIEAVLDAEAAADVRGDDADRVLGHAEHVREHPAGAVRRLRRVPDVEAVAGLATLVAGYDTPGLERLPAQAAEAEVEPQYDVGFGEGAIDVADVVGHRGRNVVVGAIVEQRRAGLERSLRIDDWRQLLVLDLDGIQRVLGQISALGDDRGHRLADVADAIGRQRIRHLGAKGAVRHQHRQLCGIGSEIGEADRVEHARLGAGRGYVDSNDACVCVRAAEESGMCHARQPDIGHVEAIAAQQPRILASAHALADVATRRNISHNERGWERIGGKFHDRASRGCSQGSGRVRRRGSREVDVGARRQAGRTLDTPP